MDIGRNTLEEIKIAIVLFVQRIDTLSLAFIGKHKVLFYVKIFMFIKM